jgi:3-mercaptopyruvate sulfurtransferase SseA
MQLENAEVRLLKVTGSKSGKVVIYGGDPGLNAANAAAMAASWGFEKVYHLRRGYLAWEEAGYTPEPFKFSPANQPNELS